MTRSAAADRAQYRRGLPAPADDAGITLVEVMVTLSVMSVVMALFTTGITQIYGATNNNEALTDTSQQLHNAFVRLDRDIRYASGISLPNTPAPGFNKYVEYAITNTGATICTQLRIAPGAGLLQTRTKIGSGTSSAWNTLASSLTSASTFSRTAASDSGNPFQQLTISLTAQAGAVGANSTIQRETVSLTFTALNTTSATASNNICGSLDRT